MASITRRFPFFLILVVILSLGLAACGDSGPMRITSVTMAKGFDDSKKEAVNPATTFSPTDNPIYSVVKMENVVANTKVTGVLTVVDAAGQQNRELARVDQQIPSEGSTATVNFKYSLDKNWPTGKYKVDILINGTLDKTVEFSMQ